MSFAVGTFVKSPDGAPVAQDIALTFRPRAVMLVCASVTAADTWTAGVQYAFGFAARNAADTVTQGTCAIAMQDNVADSNTARRQAAKALTIVDADGTLLAECDVTFPSSTGFRVTWTTNNATAYIVSYMAWGGQDLQDAYVKTWTMPTGTDATYDVTGVGFQPTALLHISGMSAGALPVGAANAIVMLGGMTAGEQVVASIFSGDAQAASNANSYLRAGSYGIYGQLTNGLANGYASYVSMDADGFTVNVADAPTAGWNVFTLCLKGGSHYFGSFTNSGSTGVVSYTAPNFAAEGGILWSHADSEQAGTNAGSGAELMIGAFSGAAQHVSVCGDDYGATTMDTASIVKTTACLSQDNSPANGIGSIDTEAEVDALTETGFDLNWTDASSGATLYYAFAGGADGLPFKLMQGKNVAFGRGAPALRGVR